eukprot:UN32224
MLDEFLDAGGRIYQNTELISIQVMDDDSFMLNLHNRTNNKKTSVPANNLFLNIPLQQLRKIIYHEETNLPLTGGDTISELSANLETASALKLYLYYERAWWHEEPVGATVGSFRTDTRCSYDDKESDDNCALPIQGRWHDGEVFCDDETDECDGFLLVIYKNDIMLSDGYIWFEKLRAIEVIQKYVGNINSVKHEFTR